MSRDIVLLTDAVPVAPTLETTARRYLVKVSLPSERRDREAMGRVAGPGTLTGVQNHVESPRP